MNNNNTPSLSAKLRTEEQKKETRKSHVPIVPLRDLVVFPKMMIPLLVGRPRSIKAVDEAMVKDRRVLLLTQKESQREDPLTQEDLYTTGTLAEVLQLLKLPDGTVKMLIEGKQVVRMVKLLSQEDYLQGVCEPLLMQTAVDHARIIAHMRVVLLLFEQYVKLNTRIPPELVSSVSSAEDPQEAAHLMSAHLTIKLQEKQQLLEMDDIEKKFETISQILMRETELLQVENKILGEVKKRIEKGQKELYLNEQLRVIEKELGVKDPFVDELEHLKNTILKAQMPKETQDHCLKELAKFAKMHPVSPEATVSRTYIDWMISLPWNTRTQDTIDIEKAKRILDTDHEGLDKAKERIIEYLAVCQRMGKIKGQILCFVGPPGVGKTSIARSIARALGRKFVHFSLGGIKDEAEIKGHRRTYIGALPGRIIQSLKKAGSRNPVFLLDEIDKMSADFRHDPAYALLEVLDPEENRFFSDHYLEREFDLSEVLFITTANREDTIPLPLHNRLEMIHFSGYSEQQKRAIALNHLIPKQCALHGVAKGEILIPEKTIDTLIRLYTKEAGVRELERMVAALIRKGVRQMMEQKTRKTSLRITPLDVEKFLGPRKYVPFKKDLEQAIGVATGLCWTPVGGEIMLIEATLVPGKSKLVLTGKLGEVMKESAQASVTFIKSHAKELGISEAIFAKHDIHVHVPEGAIPKDGPSAGVAITCAVISCLRKKPIKAGYAMTGEITLRGKVLPVGGIKEKVLAAIREDIYSIILPEDNKKDVQELPTSVQDKGCFIWVNTIEEVIKAVW